MPGPHFEDVAVANGAEAFLAQINANPDVDYIFANTGTDHGPILEALAKMHRSESKGAEIIVVPHEQAAVSMAHGYYCASGKPQVVLVHTLPGTANGLGGLMNAKACQVPMLFVAGGPRSPRARWRGARAATSTGARNPGTRAPSCASSSSGISRTAPTSSSAPSSPGPSRSPWRNPGVRCTCRCRASGCTSPWKPPGCPRTCSSRPASTRRPWETFRRRRKSLMGAANPVILTRYLGKTPAAVKPLVELADLLAIPVVQHPQSPYMNFPSSHPCHAGHDIDGHVKRADVVFLIDIDVPWTPANRDKLLPEARGAATGDRPAVLLHSGLGAFRWTTP